ncbi:SCO family protein [Orrella daihaiensis]|uniref:SCO family protein n=1 Tax=Orrella daihaiensis TaxID=2782176 RepID=A0ABY4ANF4_9BURK|nr:SCO family protein [Orrella daihaiensis]UOD50590.1 SCO family protein [Orrella daihaiensis]
MALLRALAVVFGLALLAACSEQTSFKGSDISGGNIGQGWVLTDHHGQSANTDRFKGKVSVVFFGFTQCPDICPASLSELHNAVAQLGPDAKDVQVLMISVDPERDSPTVMKDYLQVFSDGLPNEFLGLTGTPEQIRQTAQAFRAYYAKVPTPNGSYTMDHSASYYLIDQEGKARVLASNQAGPDALAHDIRLLLQ